MYINLPIFLIKNIDVVTQIFLIYQINKGMHLNIFYIVKIWKTNAKFNLITFSNVNQCNLRYANFYYSSFRNNLFHIILLF